MYSKYHKLNVNGLRWAGTFMNCGGKSLNNIKTYYTDIYNDRKYYSFEEVLEDRMNAMSRAFKNGSRGEEFEASNPKKTVFIARGSDTLNRFSRKYPENGTKPIRDVLKENGWGVLFVTNNSYGGSISLEVWATQLDVYSGKFYPIGYNPE